MTVTIRRLLLVLACLCAVWCGPRTARAAGQVYQKTHDRMELVVNAVWAGGSQGGYYPLRIQIINYGESRELTFRFEPDPKNRMPRVERTIQANQNVPEQFTLPIPLVGTGSSGLLEVTDENGKAIEQLEQTIRLPGAASNISVPAALVISNTRVDTRALGRAALRLGTARNGGSRSYGFGRQRVSTDATHVSLQQLPTVWRDYSCVDLVFVDLVTLGKLTKDQRGGLRSWVQCGGTLVLYNVGERPTGSKELNSLLELPVESPASGRWRGADFALQGKSRAELSRVPFVESVVRGGRLVRKQIRLDLERYNWPVELDRSAFYVRDLMFGKLVAFPGSPFGGSDLDWAWFLMSVGPDRYRWSARHGVSPRRPSSDFQEFLIPGVKGVPVYSFLFLITAFTVLIGPVNYLLLWRRKRLFLLVLTIPVIAFGTSLTLFGYSVVSNGFDVKTRVRSLTILDQRNREAVSMSRVAMFAGIPPSGGLRFQNETAVYPLWPHEREFDAGAVDWTDGQRLASGWLRSRTRTQFVIVNRRRERGRLVIEAENGVGLSLTNGFEWPVEAVLVADRDGKLHFAKSLQPGATARSEVASGPDLRQFDSLLARNGLGDETEDGTRVRRNIFGFSRRFRRSRLFRYRDNAMERRIAEFRQIRHGSYRLPPGSYLAVVPESPGLDLGVEDPTEYSGYHLILGYY